MEDALHVALRKKEWLRPEHRVGDPAGYMRHVLYVDPGDNFVITAIVWLPGQSSAIHGHQVWCMYGVAEGELTEEQFGPSRKFSIYRNGDLADRDLDCALVHQVYNRTDAPIVSLHLYGVSADKLTTGINRSIGFSEIPIVKKSGKRTTAGAPSKGTPGRQQVRESTAPRVNVPRQSKRPVERSNQRRSRRP